MKESAASGAPLAIVSGGSSGIGLACAAELGRKGFRVALLARDSGRLAAARAALEGQGIAVAARSVDVRDRLQCERAVGALVAAFGPPRWLVTAAGIVEPGFFLEQDPARVEEQVETNLLGTYYLVRAAAPAMTAAPGGRILLVSSAAGLFGVAGYAGYSATKFAVRGLAEVLRIELAGAGITVTLAMPPDTDTPQLAYEASRRPPAIAGFAGGGGALPAARVAAHMIRTAERGGFLAVPTLGLRLAALLQDAVSRPVRAVQKRLLRRARK